MTEIDILLEFVGVKDVDKSDYIVEISKLRSLAGMHESLAWFSGPLFYLLYYYRLPLSVYHCWCIALFEGVAYFVSLTEQNALGLLWSC
jgi:hypothetical protein